MDPTLNQNQQLDPQAVMLAKAIRQVESGGNFQARGKSGEFGAYQYTGPTWASDSQKYLGTIVPLDQATPQQQNEVAYKKIKELKDSGYNVGQISSIWNSGKPDAYLDQNYTGTNQYGAKYDVPKYARSVATAYQTLKQGGAVGADPNNPSSVNSVANANIQRSAGLPPTDGYSVGGFLGNVLKSGGNLIGGIAGAALHPIRTVENLGNAAQGAVELLVPGEQGHEEQAKAIGKFFADRYGGLDKIKNSFYNDPIGVALDLSTVLTGGAAALGGASKVAKLAEAGDIAGQLGRGAQVVSKVAEATDPLRAATNLIGKAGEGAGKVATEAAGITTGAGGEAIRTIYQAGREGGDILKQTTDALRGRLQAEDVLETAQGALKQLADQRRASYLEQFNNIVKKDVEAGKNIDKLPFDTIESTMKQQLDNFGIKVGEGGKLDFRTSSIGDRAAQKVAQEVFNDVSTWKDRTAQGLDTLKRRLDSYYKETGDTRALVQSTKSAVRDTLKKNIPGYEKMTKGYEEASDALKETQAAIGNPNKISQEGALRKIRSIFRDSQKDRLKTVENLQSKTGTNIKGQVAGLGMNPVVPGGLAKYVAEGAGFGALLHPGAAAALLPGLLTTSPRFVAEIARTLGITARKLESIISVLEKSGLNRQEILMLLVQGNRTSGAPSASSSGQ